jgi:hypothetical protein
MLNRRLQVLVDDERYDRLSRESVRLGAPVGELVRRAIDHEFPPPIDRAAAARALLSMPPPPGQASEPDWEQQKEEMLDERARKLEAP